MVYDLHCSTICNTDVRLHVNRVTSMRILRRNGRESHKSHISAHEAISTPTLPAIILAALLTLRALRLTCCVAAGRGNGSGSGGGGSGSSGGGGCGGRDSIGVGVGVAPTPTPSCPTPAQSTHRATFLRAIGLERGRGRGCHRSRRVE